MYHDFKNVTFRITVTSPRGQWVNQTADWSGLTPCHSNGDDATWQKVHELQENKNNNFKCFISIPTIPKTTSCQLEVVIVTPSAPLVTTSWQLRVIIGEFTDLHNAQVLNCWSDRESSHFGETALKSLIETNVTLYKPYRVCTIVSWFNLKLEIRVRPSCVLMIITGGKISPRSSKGHQSSRAGTSNYTPRYLQAVVTCPRPWYLLLAHKPSYIANSLPSRL